MADHDLSISELDQTLKPFTLLAPPEPEESPQRHSAKARGEKLQSDIFILRKLNASFELFNEALQDTGSANQVILRFIHIPHLSFLITVFSALPLSSSKPKHFLTNM
jgi:hypothetical protein